MESTDSDFVEIRVDEEMNDLDDDKSDLGQNNRNGGLRQQTSKMEIDENQKKSKPAEVTEEFYDLELDSEPDTDLEEVNEDAEENEMELMNMPSLQAVMSDLSQLKQRRRVLVHPIKVQELGHQKVLDIISKVTCEEIKLHFVRPHNKPEEWHGILLMHFGSTKAAQQATDNLKAVRSDLNIRCKEDTAYATRLMDQWVKEEKGQKRWTETLLWVKNIPADAEESDLHEAFPDAEDITMHHRVGKMNGPKETKEAFVVYQNGETAQKAAKAYEAHSPMIKGRTLKVLKYHMPQEMLPRGLLKLKERLLVLKYLEKLTEIKSKSESDESKVPDWCTQRLEKCRSLVDKDSRVRRLAGLPIPSLEELRALKGIKVIRGSECKENLQRLGVLPQMRRLTSEKNRNSSSNSTDDGKKPKIQSLFELQDLDQTVGRQGSRNPKYPSLLGDGPVPLLMAGPPLSPQWGSSVSPLRNPVNAANHGFTNLGSASKRTVVNSATNQVAFAKQGNVHNLMSLMEPHQTRTVVLHSKVPLLASPTSAVEMTNPKYPSLLQTTASHKPSLFSRDFVEPPNKILRLDASGSFHVEFTGHKHKGSNAASYGSSSSSRLTSLMDL